MSYTPKLPGRGKLHKAVLATAGAACLLLGGGLSAQASNWPGPLPANPYGDPASGTNYQRIEILTNADGGSTNDGTLVFGNANPTYPSTGTGVFQPFKRVQRSSGGCGESGAGDCLTFEDPANPGTFVEAKSQNGFNTDAPQSDVNFDTKNGTWTHSVTMSDFNITGTGGYIELALDANQIGCATCLANRLVITDLQIYIGPNLDNPEAADDGVEGSGYTGVIFDPTSNSLLGQGPVWTLDSHISSNVGNGIANGNGNVDILLQAGICDSPGQCGSGHGDMSIFIPVANLGSFSNTDNFVLYSEYLYVNDGFEEWNFRNAQIAQVSEPGAMALFGLGVIGMGYVRRRRHMMGS